MHSHLESLQVLHSLELLVLVTGLAIPLQIPSLGLPTTLHTQLNQPGRSPDQGPVYTHQKNPLILCTEGPL